MIKHFIPPIRGLILDMDGVLWKDSSPIGDLPAIFNSIRSQGLKVILATNNATNSVTEYIDKIEGFGVELDPWQIVTSAMASVHALVKEFPKKGAVYIVGENGLIDRIGFIEDAIDRAIRLAELDKNDVKVVKYKAEPRLSEILFGENATRPSFDVEALLETTTPRAYYLCTWLPGLASNAK